MSLWSDLSPHVKFLERLQIFSLFTFVVTSTFSIAGAHLSLGVLAIAILIRSWRSRRWLLNKTGWEWPLAAFAVACLLSSLFSEVPFTSLKNLKHLLVISAVYLVGASLRERPGLRRSLVWTLVVSGAIVALLAVLQWLMGLHDRAMGTQTTTMTFGAVAILVALMTAALAIAAPEKDMRRWSRLLLLPQVMALLLSLVRGALVGFVAGLLTLLWRSRRRFWIGAAIILLPAILAAPQSVRDRIAQILDPKAPTTLVRLTQWKNAWVIFRDNPVFGVGWRDLRVVQERYVAPDPALPPEVTYDVFHIGHFHNIYVMALVYFGIIGALAFFCLMGAVLWHLQKWRRHSSGWDRAVLSGCLAAFVGFLVSGIFDWTFGDAEVVTLLWLTVGCAFGHGVPTPESGDGKFAGEKPAEKIVAGRTI